MTHSLFRVSTRLGLALALVAAAILAGPARAQDASDIGIPTCDRFITSYEVCVTTKMPATHRLAFTEQLAQLRTAWRELARDPQTRQQLEAVCLTQGEQMRRGLEPFGCAF